MPRSFFKFKLLLDEDFYYRQRLPILIERYDLIHIVGDLKHSDIPDSEVYRMARKQKRLLITANTSDFQKLATKSKYSGVIGVSANLTPSQADTKLTALLTRSTPNDLFGRFTYVSGESL